MRVASVMAECWWANPHPHGCLTLGVRAPLRQPGLTDGLDSWHLSPGYLDKGKAGFDSDLFKSAFAYLQKLQFDARYDRAYGLHGRLVLHANTHHPRPYRIDFGICHGQGVVPTQSRLVSYNATSIPPHLWCKRHLPPLVFLLVAHVCTVLRPHIPQLQHLADPFPNSITLHWYPSCRTPGNMRGDTRLGYHTDSVPTRPGSRTAQRDGTPVISISWGETMWFWVRNAVQEWALTELAHGSVLVWSSNDDKSGAQHAVCYPPSDVRCYATYEPGGRWVVVCRWLDTVREHEQRYPHYNAGGRECTWLNV